jgi:hypothetical protein
VLGLATRIQSVIDGRHTRDDVASRMSQSNRIDDLLGDLRHAERKLASASDGIDPSTVAAIREMLGRVETSTPGGAPLHAQLDNVRKWLDALDHPDDHDRFGGAAHLRDYVITQLRLTLGALEDYRREMGPR